MTGSSELGASPGERVRARLTPTQVVLERISAIRKTERLSLPKLAERLAEQGSTVSESRLWNLSSGRARLQFDTVIAVASALGVSPLAFLTLPTEDPAEVEVLPGVTLSAERWNAWVSGTSPLPGASDAVYAEHHPYGAPIGRYKGDLDRRARALAIRLASHADEAASAAEALREEAHAYAASLLEGDPSEDLIRSAEALSKNLGIDLTTLTPSEATEDNTTDDALRSLHARSVKRPGAANRWSHGQRRRQRRQQGAPSGIPFLGIHGRAAATPRTAALRWGTAVSGADRGSRREHAFATAHRDTFDRALA